MTDTHEQTLPLPEEQGPPIPITEAAPQPENALSTPNVTEEPQPEHLNGTADDETRCRYAEAGRKGAHRLQELIQEGKLYEQEHGLKSGRQRRRQLIEMGKRYEQEHGLRPVLRKKRGERLSRMGREEVLASLLRCLRRLAKPSFRTELARLAEFLQSKPDRAA